MENKKTERLDSEGVDLKIIANSPSTKWSDLFSSEQHDAFRRAYCRRFDEAWKGSVTCNNISIIRGVTTTSVVTYFNKDIDNRTHHIAETIEAIGSGKPKMSLTEKLKKAGLTRHDVEVMLANWDEC